MPPMSSIMENSKVMKETLSGLSSKVVFLDLLTFIKKLAYYFDAPEKIIIFRALTLFLPII